VGYLRIIGGEHRGRRIAVPRGAVVRPTADRAREALYSILGSAVTGARVLDAYAGSGALGLEALSRGAGRATFIEADRRALLTLRANASTLGVESRCVLHHGPVVEVLAGRAVAGPFELILADPPYGAGEARPFLELAAGLLAEAGLIVLEREARDGLTVAAGLECTRTARYGRCSLDFYIRTSRC
jgi:16S rRNA (guanine966-N2)-methyltransferase